MFYRTLLFDQISCIYLGPDSGTWVQYPLPSPVLGYILRGEARQQALCSLTTYIVERLSFFILVLPINSLLETIAH